MRNKNFHSWRKGTINIRTGKGAQKIERVMHEIGNAKLSVCCLQEASRLNNNSVIILQTNKTMLSENTNSTGLTMELKGNTESVSPLKWIKILR